MTQVLLEALRSLLTPSTLTVYEADAIISPVFHQLTTSFHGNTGDTPHSTWSAPQLWFGVVGGGGKTKRLFSLPAVWPGGPSHQAVSMPSCQ